MKRKSDIILIMSIRTYTLVTLYSLLITGRGEYCYSNNCSDEYDCYPPYKSFIFVNTAGRNKTIFYSMGLL